jgi:hypothetical protein
MGKKIIHIILLLLIVENIGATEISAGLFCIDEEKLSAQFAELKQLEAYILSFPEIPELETILHFPEYGNLNVLTNYTIANKSCMAPGRIPSFWFSFALSAVGTYSLYGAVAGPISVGIVYLAADKDKKEVKKAIWGCVTGTILGAGIKYAVVKLR